MLFTLGLAGRGSAAPCTRQILLNLCPSPPTKRQMQVGFFPLGPAALTLRMLFTLVWLGPEHSISAAGRIALVTLLWAALCVLQPLLGYAVKIVACAYVMRHNAAQGGKPGPRVIHVKDHGAAGGAAPAAGKGGGAAAAGSGAAGGAGAGYAPHGAAAGRQKVE